MTNSTLHAQIVGEGTPVLAVHGWEMNGATEAVDFEPIFADIPGYKRIYVDLPGMGKTPIEDSDDLDAMYLRLSHFVRTVIGSERFLLMGSSCGAYLCRALVHDFANQLDGVLLRVPLIEPDNAKRDLDPFQLLVSDSAHIASLSAQDAAMMSDAVVQTPEYTATMRRRTELALAAVAESDGQKLAKIRNDTSKYCLTRPLDVQIFPAPSLILCGRHDSVVGYRDAMALIEKYPRASFAVLDRGVHAMPVDENDVFTALVRDWLVRAREWQKSQSQNRSFSQ